MGFDQEETAKRLWATGHSLGEQAANPEMLIRYGAENVYDEETGMKLPEKIVVYGSFQSHVGAVKNDSNSELTRMYYIGEHLYAFCCHPVCGNLRLFRGNLRNIIRNLPVRRIPAKRFLEQGAFYHTEGQYGGTVPVSVYNQ